MNPDEFKELRSKLVGNLLSSIDIDGEVFPARRGELAALKMFLRSQELARNRAIPAFAQFAGSDLIDDRISETIAAFFGQYPHRAPENFGDFGVTCRRIAEEFNEGAFDARFERLLTAKTGENAAKIVLQIAPMARSERIPVNFQELAHDLGSWDQKIRLKWARSYFKVSVPTAP